MDDPNQRAERGIYLYSEQPEETLKDLATRIDQLLSPPVRTQRFWFFRQTAALRKRLREQRK